VIEAEAPDQGVVVNQRTDDGRLQRAGGIQADGVGRRVRAGNCRLALTDDCAEDAAVVTDGCMQQPLALGADCEAALEQVRVGIVKKQGAPAPRHNLGDLRGDQRHRVRHAETGAHRLRDLVERVDLTMRERDVFERAGGRGAHQAGGGAGGRRLRARRGYRFRLRILARLFHQSGQQLDEDWNQVGIERPSHLVLQQPDRALHRQRGVIRPLRGDGVVVIDNRQDPRAHRDLFAGQ
jgi:hypothetical protein